MDNPFEVNDEKIHELYLSRKLATWDDLIREIALLRQALEAVEWKTRIGFRYADQEKICIWCANYQYEGHKPDCLRQRALGLVKDV